MSEDFINKIYEKILETGVVTDNQLVLIMMYEKQNKNSETLKALTKYGKDLIKAVDKIFPNGDVK